MNGFQRLKNNKVSQLLNNKKITRIRTLRDFYSKAVITKRGQFSTEQAHEIHYPKTRVVIKKDKEVEIV